MKRPVFDLASVVATGACGGRRPGAESAARAVRINSASLDESTVDWALAASCDEMQRKTWHIRRPMIERKQATS